MGNASKWYQLLEEVIHTVEESGVKLDDNRPCRLVLGVSGGVDSMALLHLCLEASKRTLWMLHVVHVHHHLRETADRDAQFVEQICHEWNVPVVVAHVEPTTHPLYAAEGVESAARAVRYAAFREEALRIGSSHLLLAHHADDQVETLLWRLLRGTSVTGLAGIRQVTAREGMTFVRPLLFSPKEDLFAYTHTYNIPYVTDETNFDVSMTRNRIRKEVIPLLKSMQPNLASVVTQTASIVQEEDAYLTEQAHIYLEHLGLSFLLRPDWIGTTVEFDVSKFAAMPRPLQRRCVKIILYCLASADWTSVHIQQILQVACGHDPSARVHIGHGLVIERQYQQLRMAMNDDEAPTDPTPYCFVWRPREQPLFRFTQGSLAWKLKSERVEGPFAFGRASPFTLWVPDTDKPFTIRTPVSGERVQPFGVFGTKKLQDVFVDAKVPRRLRSAWPLVELGGQIVWVPGVLRCAHATLTQDDWVALRIHAYRTEAPRRQPDSGNEFYSEAQKR